MGSSYSDFYVDRLANKQTSECEAARNRTLSLGRTGGRVNRSPGISGPRSSAPNPGPAPGEAAPASGRAPNLTGLGYLLPARLALTSSPIRFSSPPMELQRTSLEAEVVGFRPVPSTVLSITLVPGASPGSTRDWMVSVS